MSSEHSEHNTALNTTQLSSRVRSASGNYYMHVMHVHAHIVRRTTSKTYVLRKREEGRERERKITGGAYNDPYDNYLGVWERSIRLILHNSVARRVFIAKAKDCEFRFLNLKKNLFVNYKQSTSGGTSLMCA